MKIKCKLFYILTATYIMVNVENDECPLGKESLISFIKRGFVPLHVKFVMYAHLFISKEQSMSGWHT